MGERAGVNVQNSSLEAIDHEVKILQLPMEFGAHACTRFDQSQKMLSIAEHCPCPCNRLLRSFCITIVALRPSELDKCKAEFKLAPDKLDFCASFAFFHRLDNLMGLSIR